MIDLTTKIEVGSPALDWVNTQENRLAAMGHVGTHLDTYCKTEIPIEYFKSPGVLIDVTSIVPARDVEVEDVQEVEIPANAFVLFRTDQLRKYGYATDAYFHDGPQLSHQLIDYLLKKKVRFIGIDCEGLRRRAEHQAADRLCETNGTYVIENLCNMDRITHSQFTVYTMWIDDIDQTGLKCRVLVEE